MSEDELDKRDPRNWESLPGIIYQQLAKVMQEVKAIEKAQQSHSGGNYKFRGIDDLYNALHDLMAKHEIFCAPSITGSVRSSYQTSKGTTMQQVTTTVKYRYYATDGSYVESECIGEGADVSDKATSKSLAMAHKYNLVQMFLIKTDDKDDVEAHDIEGEGTPAMDGAFDKGAPVPEEETETVAFGSQDMVDPPDSKGEIETKDIKRIFAKLHGLRVSDTLAQHEVVSEILGFNATLPSMNYLSVAQGDKVVTELMRREKAQR